MQMQHKIKAIEFICIIVALLVSPCFAVENGNMQEQILFVRNGDLWNLNITKNEESLLLKDAKSPVCSKEGARLAFVRNGNIWIMDIEGRNQKKVTNYPLNKKDIKAIEWFPTGDKLAFSVDDDYELTYFETERKLVWPEDSYEQKKSKLSMRGIWITNIDGKFQKKWIGNVPGSGTNGTRLSDVDAPKWSPGGDAIVFSRNGDIWIAKITNDELFYLNKKEKRVAAVAYLENHYGASGNSHIADHFSWTPDGNQIVFDIHRYEGSGFGEIWRMNADGNEQKKLFSPNEESFPQISPDGKKIAFIQGFSLWIMNIDGSSPEKKADSVEMDQITWCEIRTKKDK